MTSSSRTFAIATAAATIAALAGCGSSGPSKADFVKKADALCAQTNKAHPPKPSPKNAKEAAAQQGAEITIRRDLDRKLKALDVPSSEKSTFATYNAGTQQILAALGRMRADALKNDQKQYGVDSRAFETAAANREKSAIKLGFKTCGRKNPVQ